MLVRPVWDVSEMSVTLQTVVPRLTYTRGTAICHTVIFQKCSKISQVTKNEHAFWHMSAGSSQYRESRSFWKILEQKGRFFTIYFSDPILLCFRVAFRRWECSHSNRTKILFRYICSIFFSTFFQKYFLVDRKKNFWKNRKHIWSEKKIGGKKNVRPKNIFWPIFLAWIYSCEIFGFFSFHFSKFFIFWKYYFPEKIHKKSEDQGRCKISLRIEWEHSQPPKITLKHSSRACFFDGSQKRVPGTLCQNF